MRSLRYSSFMAIKILVVEDQPNSREIYTLLLKLEGYEVIRAKNGRAGYKKAVEESPDLVFTDLSMPKMSGDTMIRRLRSKKKFAKLPIVAVTAHTLVSPEAQAALAAGADRVIDKTADLDVLLAIIRQLVNS
jgi:DNA-binding response OmpR family regulator